MNAKERSVGRIGWILSGALALAVTGCATHVHKRTVYVPPPVVVAPPPVVVTPPPEPPPPVVVTPSPVVVTPPAAAPVVVIESERDFYEPLSPYGRWVAVPGYGYSWVPSRVEVDWRPYSDGYWQRTEAGWYWMSEEPWGWATYHYGRWDWNAQFGWFWVPQTQWAPAWVAWREGGGYVGWAPLRPSVSISVSLTSVDYEPAFASRAFVFVEHRHMMERVRPRTVVVNNTTIINKTVNITKVSVVNKTVINEGPRPEVIERESGRKIHTVATRDFRHREETAVAERNRTVTRSNETRVETSVRNNANVRPTPKPSPREEVPARSEPRVTQSSVPARPVTVNSPAPVPPKRGEAIRPERRESNASMTGTVRGQFAEKKVEPPVARPPENRPAAARAIEKPGNVVTRTVPPPASTSQVRSDIRPTRDESEIATRRLVGAAANRSKVGAASETERSLKRETKQVSPVNRPSPPASVKPAQNAQVAPAGKSQPSRQMAARATERGKRSEKTERE